MIGVICALVVRVPLMMMVKYRMFEMENEESVEEQWLNSC